MRYIASRRYPIVYMPMAKSGLTTTLNYLHLLDTGALYEHPLEIHQETSELFITGQRKSEITARLQTDKVFTFVRHPLRRAYSLFSEKGFHEHEHSFPQLRARLLGYGASLRTSDDIVAHRRDFKVFLDLVRFDIARSRASAKRLNPHWQPQHHFFQAAMNFRMPDFVGRTEQLTTDFRLFLTWVGVDVSIPELRYNEGPPYLFPYDAIVDDAEIKEIGREIFSQDLKAFGYQI